MRRKCLSTLEWHGAADKPARPAMPQVWGSSSVGDGGKNIEYLTVPAS
jgi:hypothetical protein